MSYTLSGREYNNNNSTRQDTIRGVVALPIIPPEGTSIRPTAVVPILPEQPPEQPRRLQLRSRHQSSSQPCLPRSKKRRNVCAILGIVVLGIILWVIIRRVRTQPSATTPTVAPKRMPTLAPTFRAPPPGFPASCTLDDLASQGNVLLSPGPLPGCHKIRLGPYGSYDVSQQDECDPFVRWISPGSFRRSSGNIMYYESYTNQGDPRCDTLKGTVHLEFDNRLVWAEYFSLKTYRPCEYKTIISAPHCWALYRDLGLRLPWTAAPSVVPTPAPVPTLADDIQGVTEKYLP